ncbi:hypothetical protein W909_01475 [Dickeya zeae EC1]|nr:hypothetical protein W909_01475 [Dickeya zeae EC1]
MMRSLNDTVAFGYQPAIEQAGWLLSLHLKRQH